MTERVSCFIERQHGGATGNLDSSLNQMTCTEAHRATCRCSRPLSVALLRNDAL